jgi:hypothetical protein
VSQTAQQNYSIPTATQQITQAGHKVDTVWFRFLSNLYVSTGSGNATATLTETQAALAALEATVAAAIAAPAVAASPQLVALQLQVSDLQKRVAAAMQKSAPLFPSYDMAVYVPGLIGAPTYALWRFTADRPFVLPVGLSGSKLACAAAPTGPVAMNLKHNGTIVGTLNIAGSAIVGTFTFTAAVIVLIGDIIEVDAPASPDATLASLNWTFAGQRLA